MSVVLTNKNWGGNEALAQNRPIAQRMYENEIGANFIGVFLFGENRNAQDFGARKAKIEALEHADFSKKKGA